MAIQEIINTKTGEYGYQVRVKGQSRYFSIKKHGGKRATLKLAKAAEKEILDALGIKSSSERTYDKPNIRNTSGVVGIHIQWRTYHGGDNVYPYISGSWKDKEGKQRMFGFSIERNGLKGAIALAFAKRKIGKLHTIDIDEAVAILKPQLSC